MRCRDGFEESEREAMSGVGEGLLLMTDCFVFAVAGLRKINNLVVNRKERNEERKSPPQSLTPMLAMGYDGGFSQKSCMARFLILTHHEVDLITRLCSVGRERNSNFYSYNRYRARYETRSNDPKR